MRRAIELSCEGVAAGDGPFGAVVVRDGVILSEARSAVVAKHDPTAHAGVVAVREACARLGTHTLPGAVIYMSSEPCPMCLGAIWWARIDEVVYGNDRLDAAAIGFDDAAIYEEVSLPLSFRTLPLRRMLAQEAIEGFRQWEAKADRVPY